LKRLVSVEAWHVYLKLEATVSQRAMLEQDELVEWALEAGRRSRSSSTRATRLPQHLVDDVAEPLVIALGA